MGPLTNRAVIRQVMEKHGFTFSKALGQNFIVNPSVCPRIAEEGGAAPGVTAAPGTFVYFLTNIKEAYICR